ncbi:enoyl-CoA hydratase isomerase family protein [Musa troglodytarum]|uniref:Enoyl-CoA hydratase isomerase family protein n=1 Tax=Musa troglodytarum TaxID=320322 RepID=A0A9E7EFH6_9LILI|nr:enoyl-CoA hydratase isomerase family protein [Musa troglodytarum]
MCSLEKLGRVYVLTLTGDNEHRLNADLIAALRSALAKVRAEYAAAPEGSASSPPPRAGSSPTASTSLGPTPPDPLRLSPAPFVPRRPLQARGRGPHVPPDAHHLRRQRPRRRRRVHARHQPRLHDDEGGSGVLVHERAQHRRPLPAVLHVADAGEDRRSEDAEGRDAPGGEDHGSGSEGEGIVDSVHAGADEALQAAMRMGEELAARNWDGGVYASIRMAAFPDLCRTVGLTAEDAEEKLTTVAAKL